jgi:hypothetical protein
LEALGFAFDCKVTEEAVDYGVSQKNGSTLWSVQFNTNFSTATKPYAHIDLNMAYINSFNGPNGSCAGTLTHRYCEIRPAVVRYPQLVQQADPNNAVNVTHLGYFVPPAKEYAFGASLDSSQIDSLQVMNYTDLPEVFGENSTVGGITFSLNNLFSSSVILNRFQSNYWDLIVSGSRAQGYFYLNSTTQITSQCGFQLNQTDGSVDPFIDLLRNINSYGYVSALYIDGAPQVTAAERKSGNYQSQVCAQILARTRERPLILYHRL